MMNELTLLGRLTKDPEAIETASGKKYCQFILAVPRNFKNAQGEYGTDFIQCVAFDKIANNLEAHYGKGDMLGIKGRIQNSEYEKDGEKKYKLEVVAEKINLLSRNKELNSQKEEQER